MNEDIINLLTENYHEAELIKKNWDEVLKSLRRQIANGVKRHLVEEHKIPKEIIFVIHKTKRGWPNVYIQGNNWGEFLKVYLQSKELMSSGFEIGLVRNESNRMDKGDLLNKLPNLIKCKKSGVRDWICKGEKIDVNKSSLSNIENFVETISLKMKGLYDTVEKDWK